MKVVGGKISAAEAILWRKLVADEREDEHWGAGGAQGTRGKKTQRGITEKVLKVKGDDGG